MKIISLVLISISLIGCMRIDSDNIVNYSISKSLVTAFVNDKQKLEYQLAMEHIDKYYIFYIGNNLEKYEGLSKLLNGKSALDVSFMVRDKKIKNKQALDNVELLDVKIQKTLNDNELKLVFSIANKNNFNIKSLTGELSQWKGFNSEKRSPLEFYLDDIKANDIKIIEKNIAYSDYLALIKNPYSKKFFSMNLEDRKSNEDVNEQMNYSYTTKKMVDDKGNYYSRIIDKPDFYIYNW